MSSDHNIPSSSELSNLSKSSKRSKGHQLQTSSLNTPSHLPSQKQSKKDDGKLPTQLIPSHRKNEIERLETMEKNTETYPKQPRRHFQSQTQSQTPSQTPSHLLNQEIQPPPRGVHHGDSTASTLNQIEKRTSNVKPGKFEKIEKTHRHQKPLHHSQIDGTYHSPTSNPQIFDLGGKGKNKRLPHFQVQASTNPGTSGAHELTQFLDYFSPGQQQLQQQQQHQQQQESHLQQQRFTKHREIS